MKNTMRCLGTQSRPLLSALCAIALIAVIGFSFAACDNGTTGGGPEGDPNSATYTSYDEEGNSYQLVINKAVNNPNPGDGNSSLNGSWVNQAGEIWVFNNGNLTVSDNGDEFLRGTYTTSGSYITITFTQIKGSIDEDGELGLSPNQWYTKSQFRSALIDHAVSLGIPQSQAATFVDELLEDEFPFFDPMTGTYSVSGNTLTISGAVLTRSGSRSAGAVSFSRAAVSRAAYAPQNGDSYTLTIKSASGQTIGTSTGYVATVNVNGAVYTITLKHNESSNTVSVTVTGSGISYFSGDISLDNYTTHSNPGTLSGTKPGGNTPGSKTGIWPPSSVLAEFGISGLSAPSGATEMWYAIMTEEDASFLQIHFDGSPAHDSAITGYFTSNGWTETGTQNGDGYYYVFYEKGNFECAYMRSSSSSVIQVESSTGGGGPNNWPTADILAYYSLSGLSVPGAIDVEYIRGWKDDVESLAIMYEVPSTNNDSAITGYFTSHGWTQLVASGGTYFFSKAGFSATYIRLPEADDGYYHCEIMSMKER